MLAGAGSLDRSNVLPKKKEEREEEEEEEEEVEERPFYMPLI